jgi:hypothetical protein
LLPEESVLAEGASPLKAPAKIPTTPPKYDTLAGLDGVSFWSDPIPIEKRKQYWLTLDAKGADVLARTGKAVAILFAQGRRSRTSFRNPACILVPWFHRTQLHIAQDSPAKLSRTAQVVGDHLGA